MTQNNAVIEQLKKQRKARKISQAKLAEMCNVPQSTIGRIESGAVAPNLVTAEKMADVLGLKFALAQKTATSGRWENLHAMCYWKDEPVSEIYVRGNEVTIKRFTLHPVKQIFSRDKMDIYGLSEVFRRRCWDENRDGIEDILKKLGLSHYDPLEIVRKTHGVSYNDFIWFQFDGELLFWKDVAPRNRKV